MKENDMSKKILGDSYPERIKIETHFRTQTNAHIHTEFKCMFCAMGIKHNNTEYV